ncbi:MAG: efflux RND transporter permease subunit [Gemmatimonadales bacterium]|jgi:HAE1 family hydrophobic/amphiphilic exporter-1
MFLSELSIKRPVFATMMMLALVVLGLFSLRRLKLDDMPDVELPFVMIQVHYPGASTEAVERDVTKKIEEAVNPIEGVDRMESSSLEGYSTIFIQFTLQTKVMNAQADVRSAIDRIRSDLPVDIDPPVVSRFDFRQNPIVSLALSGQGWALRDLTQLATETISRRLETVDGVGSVTVVGGLDREIHVLVIPPRLDALGVSPDMVMAALRRENMDTPAGRVEQSNAEQLVRVKGRVVDPAQFASVVVATRNGVPVRLGEVARIEDAQEEERTLAEFSGKRAIGIDIRKISGANTVDVANGIKQVMAQLNTELPSGIRLEIVRDNSTWIKSSLADVQLALMLGALLTVLIVFIFLNSWRSTVITGLTLPVSIISAFLVIYAMNFTINTLTLMALSLAVGILIDDAIVVRENIVRHVERGEDHYTAANAATSEIGFAVFATTMSILAVFVPVGFMGGIVGRFFYQFGITVAFAVAVSLFVSFTLDPMLSSLWYDPQAAGHAERGPIGKRLETFNGRVRDAGRWYREVISWALDHRGRVLAIAGAAFAAAIMLMGVGAVGGQFSPTTDRSELNVTIQTPVGSSIGYTRAKGEEIDRYLRSLPEVAYSYFTIGGGTQRTVTDGTIYVRMKPKSERSVSEQDFQPVLRRHLAAFKGVKTGIMEASGMGGGQLPVQVNILGPDVTRLQELNDRMMAAIRDVPGLVDLKSSLEGRKPEYVIEVNRDLAANVGVTIGSLSSSLRTILSGQTATSFEDETGLTHDVVVRVAPEYRTSFQDLARVPVATSTMNLRTQSPVMVPLGQVAQIHPSGAPAEIRRLSLERMARIEGNYQGRALTKVMGDIKKRMATVPLPPGYRIDIGGEQKMFGETVGYIVESLVLAIIFVYLILASQFGSFLQPLAIMLSLPLSIIGVLVALLLTGDTFNMLSMIGLIMLMGLVTKNAILLVDFANKARDKGATRRQALIDAGEIRFRPIMMTTFSMIFGMLPTALALGEGGEFRAPMARAVIGGLVTSTMLTLIVVPVVYTYLDDFGSRVVAWLAAGKKAPVEAAVKKVVPEPEAVPAD